MARPRLIEVWLMQRQTLMNALCIRQPPRQVFPVAVLTGATLLVLANRRAAAEGPSDVQQSEVFISGMNGYHTYRIPALVVRAKGTLLVFCEGRKTKLFHAGPSALAVIPDGTICCLHETGKKGPYETIALARFPMEWLERICQHLLSTGRVAAAGGARWWR
jgi:hypothetical protein